MRYLALGDSISIDDYTGVEQGGAASQLARRLRSDDFLNLTGDGYTTGDVLRLVDEPLPALDLVTLTIGGNDLLMGVVPSSILSDIERIAEALESARCPVIMNTVYDPTDGDDRLASILGMPVTMRGLFNELNDGIRRIAASYAFILSDLEILFHGHGMEAPDSWFVNLIEPNYAGATAIADHWYQLFTAAQ